MTVEQKEQKPVFDFGTAMHIVANGGCVTNPRISEGLGYVGVNKDPQGNYTLTNDYGDNLTPYVPQELDILNACWTSCDAPLRTEDEIEFDEIAIDLKYLLQEISHLEIDHKRLAMFNDLKKVYVEYVGDFEEEEVEEEEEESRLLALLETLDSLSGVQVIKVENDTNSEESELAKVFAKMQQGLGK